MSNKLAQIQDVKESREKISGFIIGVLEEVDDQGRLYVSWDAVLDVSDRQMVSHVRSMDIPVNPTDTGRKVILGFENGNSDQPILFGFLEQAEGRKTVELVPEPDISTEIPDSLHLKSEQELILECGKAKISLRADGRIVILGGYVVSRSTGVNKIKGGSVQIN